MCAAALSRCQQARSPPGLRRTPPRARRTVRPAESGMVPPSGPSPAGGSAGRSRSDGPPPAPGWGSMMCEAAGCAWIRNPRPAPTCTGRRPTGRTACARLGALSASGPFDDQLCSRGSGAGAPSRSPSEVVPTADAVSRFRTSSRL
jgi:hypothetical protein